MPPCTDPAPPDLRPPVPETESDRPAVEALLARCFGPARRTRTVYRFRDSVAPRADLCLVARGADGALAGSIRFWPVRLPGAAERAALLGPLAVEPSLRGAGIGRALIRAGLGRARAAGDRAILVVGDPGYYAPLGFSTGAAEGLILPGPVAPLFLLGLNLGAPLLPGLRGPVRPADEA